MSGIASVGHTLRRAAYAPVLAVAMGLMMVRLLVMARVLDVGAFADFSAGMLVSNTFCMFGCLGLQVMLQREWPVDHVRRRESHARLRLAQCNWVAVIGAALTLGAVAIGAVPAVATAAAAAAGVLHGLAHQVFLVSSTESRSRGESMRFARQNLARALAALGLSLVVAWATGSAAWALAVDAAATLAVAMAAQAVAWRRGRLAVAAAHRLAWRRLGRVDWQIALTLMANMIVVFALLNLDRWVAAHGLAAQAFAMYAFAWISLSIAQAAQAVVNAAVFPALARRLAEAGRAGAFRLALRACVATLLAGAVIALPAAWMASWAVERWLPHYREALVLLPPMLAIGLLRLSDYWSGFLLVAGHESGLLGVNLLVLALGVLAWAVWLRPAAGALGPADAVSLAGALTALSFTAAALLAWRARHG